MPEALRSKIFLSCGQNKDPKISPLDEYSIVQGLKATLENKLGFEVYIAVEEQNVAGLVDDIFRNLRDSEYFLFIDFKREELALKSAEPVCRGSLFTNQELALAKFLEMEIIAYQEEGVKKEDGILKFIHVNPTNFPDRKNLVDVVVAEVNRKWRSGWKNRLVLRRNAGESVDALHQWKRPARWFHVEVKNQHSDRIARDCVVFMEKIMDVNDRRDISPKKLVEFKWEGVTTSRVTIPPQKSRNFDAFYVFEDQQNAVYLGVNPFIADYSELLYRLPTPRKYELTFVVFSNDFPAAREKFILDSGGNLGNTKFYKEGEEPPSSGPQIVSAEVQIASTVVTSGSSLILRPGTLIPLADERERYLNPDL